jgi:hypothetical protein
LLTVLLQGKFDLCANLLVEFLRANVGLFCTNVVARLPWGWISGLLEVKVCPWKLVVESLSYRNIMTVFPLGSPSNLFQKDEEKTQGFCCWIFDKFFEQKKVKIGDNFYN